MEYIGYLILAAAAAFGIAEWIGLIQRRIARGREKGITVSMIPLSGHIEDVELMVRNAVSAMQWSRDAQNVHILLIDSGMDEETKEVCQYLCEVFTCVSLCEKDELSSVMARKLEIVLP